MRDYVCFYLNGERQVVKGEAAFQQMSDYLRYACHKTGTKVVCAEGDCGACTVNRAFPLAMKSESLSAADSGEFQPVNSCVAPVFLFDGCNVVTVEGLKTGEKLHPVQEAMVKCNGGQCGFCTPGFVMAMTGMFEKRLNTLEAGGKVGEMNTKKAQNYLTGNLCRCTGYRDILDAALAVKPAEVVTLKKRYGTADAIRDLRAQHRETVGIEFENLRLRIPATLDEALRIKAEFKNVLIVSGATDLGVQVNKEKIDFTEVLSINLVSELHRIEQKAGEFSVGAKVTLSALLAAVEDEIPEFAKFLHIFASPQIKNIATLAGNVMNASPIADNTPFLMVFDAKIELASTRGRRMVPITEFYKGYKKMDLATDEILTRIVFSAPAKSDFMRFYKVSQRRDLDISGLNAAFLLKANGDIIEEWRMSLGGVGPTTLRLKKSEALAKGQKLNAVLVAKVKEAVLQEIAPFSDVRGSREFRQVMAMNLIDKFFSEWKKQS